MLSPLQFYITSFTNKDLMEKLGIANWDIHLSEQYFMELFANEPKENICYLTSDSPNELETFDQNKVYIIGGLVDHK
jgi:tRNA (guanine9-N1)-methyltransferase